MKRITPANLLLTTLSILVGVFLFSGVDRVSAEDYAVSMIPVQNGPFDVAINHATNLMYVSNQGANSVSVIDSDTLEAVANIPVASPGSVPMPTGIGVNSETNRVYVANQGTGSVSVIDGAANTVIAEVMIGLSPVDVVVDSSTNRIYVTTTFAFASLKHGTVVVIDGNSNTIIGGPVPTGLFSSGAALNPVTGRLYVANSGGNSVTVIDTVTLSVMNTISSVGVGPSQVGIDALTNRIYVANYSDNTVAVINGEDSTVLSVIPVGISPLFGLEVSPDTERAYVTNVGDGTVSILSLAANTLIDTVPVGNSPVGAALDDDAGVLYVANAGSNTISVIEVMPSVIEVAIDIMPGCINSNGHGVIPVAILSGLDFDATQVDPQSVSLDGQGVRVVGRGNVLAHVADVNSDGLADLMMQIEDADGSYQPGDAMAALMGETFDGTAIQGIDSICIVP